MSDKGILYWNQWAGLFGNKGIESIGFRGILHRIFQVHHADVAKEIVQNFWLALWENPRMLRPDKDGCAKVFLMQYLRFRIYDIYRIAVPETVPIDETDIVSPLLAGADMEKEELLHIVCDALKNSTLLTKKNFLDAGG